MKVSPGVWYLQLAPGRSSELYVMKEDGQGSSSNTTLSKRITIDDLRGKLVHLEVVKRKGKEHEKLLVSSDNDEGYSTEKVSRGFVFDEFLVLSYPFFSLFLRIRNLLTSIYRVTRKLGILISLNGLLELLVEKIQLRELIALHR